MNRPTSICIRSGILTLLYRYCLSISRYYSISSAFILSTSWLLSSLLVSCSPWAINRDRELSQNNGNLLSHIAFSAKWKYKTVSIILAFLMAYLLFAAVECAIQAAKQGGTAYQIMWFSIVVTWGGETQYSYSGYSSLNLTLPLRSLHRG